MGVAVVVALTAPVVAAEDVIDATQPRLAPVAAVPVYAAGVDATAPHRPLIGGGAEDINTFSQIVSANITTNGAGALDYVALILDRDSSDNLYIKVQGGGGVFTSIGFYHGVNGGAWLGMTGGVAFFTLAAADQFTSAHMTVIHDGLGNVTLQLTNVVGGTNNQTYTRGGWVPRFAAGVGYGAFSGNYSVDNWGHDTVCDDFNRPDGPLGVDWVTTDGTGAISGNTARGSGTSRSIYVGACGGGLAVAEADIAMTGATGIDLAALVLNADSGDNLYIKVQRNTAGTTYDSIGFYHGLNVAGWPGQTGGGAFFILPVDQEFTTAHMKVIMEANGNVRLILTDMDTVVGPLEFSRGAWAVRNAHAAGIGGFDGNARMDNFSVSGLGVLDSFNRANGGLGASWQTVNGTAAITGGAAAAGSGTASRSFFTGVAGNTSTCPADSAPPGGDGIIDVNDLLKVINSWGTCP